MFVCFSRYREFMSYKAFKGDRGVGSPEKPFASPRQKRNLRSGYRDAFRTLFRRRLESLPESSRGTKK